ADSHAVGGREDHEFVILRHEVADEVTDTRAEGEDAVRASYDLPGFRRGEAAVVDAHELGVRLGKYGLARERRRVRQFALVDERPKRPLQLPACELFAAPDDGILCLLEALKGVVNDLLQR